MNKLYYFLLIGIFSVFPLHSQQNKCFEDNQRSDYLLKSPELPSFMIPYDKSNPGITSSFDFTKELIPLGKAEKYQPKNKQFKKAQNDIIQADGNMVLMDSIYMSSFIPAGSSLGVKINIPEKKLDIVTPLKLSDEAKAAINKAPLWIRPALANSLSKVYTSKQIELANIINNAVDPYIDEIAYSIAYSTNMFLSNKYCYPQMFQENASLLYAHDADLGYVQITDYGSSTTDENYYSTVKYFKIDTNGNKVQIEVPKEIYYEYIVHPKTSDEISSYVNPSRYENATNKLLNLAAPPLGKFWRDYLYTITEAKLDNPDLMYPILKDSVALCEVMWDEKNLQRSAVREVGNWIRGVMSFTSEEERPHQPIRIYKLHIGRCGEHEDITNAASRACLIPCRGIEAFSSDHVWNEFWDEKWWQWEPVNNSFKDNYCYSKGWGKKFGSIFARASRGVVESVTDDYCENTATIVVYALDVNDNPIDGAVIMLAAKGTLDDESLFVDCYGITDNEGKATFIVDTGRDYFGRVDCSLGSQPPSSSNVAELILGAEAGKTYQYQLKVNASMPKAEYSELDPPEATTINYRLDVNYKLKNSFINWFIKWDDFTNSYTYKESLVCNPNIFITDEENYNLLGNKNQFSAISKNDGSSEGTFSFEFESPDKTWYCVFNTNDYLNNYSYIDAYFKLYLSPLVSVEENNIGNMENQLNVFPNPVINEAYLSIKIYQTEFVEIDILNTNGSLVKNIVSTHLDKGDYNFTWDATDYNMNRINSGLYFIRLKSENSIIYKKIVVVR